MITLSKNIYPKIASFVVISTYCLFAALVLIVGISIYEVPKVHHPELSFIMLFLLFPCGIATKNFFIPIESSIDGVTAYRDNKELKNKILPLLGNINSDVRVGTYESDEINAYAISTMSGRKSLIAFSSSAVEILLPNQFMALAAHEIAHIKNSDSRNKIFIRAFHEMLNIYPNLVFECAKELCKKSILLSIVALLAIPLLFSLSIGGISAFMHQLALLGVIMLKPMLIILSAFAIPYFLNKLTDALFFAYGRQCEYIADSDGADMTSVSDMVQVLEQLTGTPDAKKSFFDTHPPLEERLDRLRYKVN